MGHRHQTYILVTDEVTHETNLTVYHCQWNYPMVQIPKILRFAKYFIPTLNKLYNNMETDLIPLTYLYTASLAPGNPIRHTDITHDYGECPDLLFNEDNNNGWLLIHVKLYDDPSEHTMLMGFRPGYEDLRHNGIERTSETERFTNLFDYLKYVLTHEERKELFAEDTLTDEERQLLEAIDNMGFNTDELRNSTNLLRVKVKQLYTDSVKV